VKFEHKLPDKSGYYWMVDIDYLHPVIVFVIEDKVYLGSYRVRWSENLRKQWAFGDYIELINPAAVEVVPYEDSCTS
jgi:hypothetical protein